MSPYHTPSLIGLAVALSLGGPRWRIDSEPRQPSRCGGRLTAPCEVRGQFTSVSAGFLHTCGIAADGGTYCWGDGRSGALGDGKRAIRASAVRVAGEDRFVEVRAGGDFTCGRTARGDVFCWGRSQAVPNFPAPSMVPTKVALPEPVGSLTSGRRHACALTEEGVAYCWGFNVDGETGSGTSGIEASVVTVPSRVIGGVRFSSISAGLDFTCALTVFGEPYCWGSNVDGLLGEDASQRCGDVAPTPCESRPVRVATSLVFQEIAAGGSHVCGRTAGGMVACWGSNGQGQLGSAGSEGKGKSSAPRRVFLQSAPPFISIVSGGIHSCALTESGALYCWGSDTGAQLGAFRNLDAQNTPVRSQWRLAFTAVSAGGYHTCGVVHDGRVYCWGDNSTGALGRE